MKGLVYVLVNESMKDIVKIGYTARDIDTRVRELSTGSGVPTGFICVYNLEFDNCIDIESQVHENFKDFRVNKKREFFKITVKEAINYIESLSEVWTSEEAHVKTLDITEEKTIKIYSQEEKLEMRKIDIVLRTIQKKLLTRPKDIELLESVERLEQRKQDILDKKIVIGV
ncbi:MAG: GIY-YIG nuclease family protein [Cetobacterium sp.]